MNEDYFILNNECSLDVGIVVVELPSITIPKQRAEEETVLGMDGVLTITDGTYEPTIKQCKVYYTGENIDGLCNYLKDGPVIFSNLPDRYYNAKIVSEIPINYLCKNNDYGSWYEFTISFRCQPFGYSTDNETLIITSKNSELYNYCSYYSKPVITIYGSGDINLFIGDTQITLKDVDEYITINTVKMRTYKDTQRQNYKKIGNFPNLNPGSNNITWDGNVSKIEIIPNFRYLI